MSKNRLPMITVRSLGGGGLSYYDEADVGRIYGPSAIQAMYNRLSAGASFSEVISLADEYMKDGKIKPGNEVDVARHVYQKLNK